MFNLGMGEITVILVLLLLFVGPSKLPELASGLGKMIRQIRKATSDVKNEIVLDDSFRKPFEELRDAVTLPPEELKRRDQIKASIEEVRRQAEELARSALGPEDNATPPPEVVPSNGAPHAVPPAVPSANAAPITAGSETEGPWPPPIAAAAPPPPVPVPPVAPPVGTFPRAATPAPLPPGRLGGAPRVTPPISFSASDRANITQVLSEEDLQPAKKGAPPPLPPPLPGVPPPPPGTKKA
ncbi:MAG TPA: twin-arginine translocase TatA/TatE family subunit [Vicinamibacterales bacterium]|nr:twin-arginine translocase TatA/TatE family subunit [Vicinamibacterales bacterium]